MTAQVDEASTRAPSASAIRTIVGDDTELPVAMAERELTAGARIDRYVVLATLGQGGMGVVYAAHDPMLDRKVALKLLQPGATRSPERARARLLREAQAMAKISSPYVVTVHDSGVFGDDVYFTMEHVEGVTLRTRARETPDDWRTLVRLCVYAARGLDAVHRAGLVHRDVKPDNVMVDGDGRVRLMDLGIAQVADIDASSSGRGIATTRTNEDATRVGPGGTPAYMAPELRLGHGTPASDQFALCVTIYEVLYGELPFAGATDMERAAAVLAGAVRPPTRSIPRALREVILRGIDADPERRWPSIDALVAAIERATRSRKRVVAAALVGTAAVGAIAFAFGGSNPELCTGAAAELAPVWSPGRADEIAAHLDGVRGDASNEWVRGTWMHMRTRLDDVGARWIATHTETCRRTQVRGERSPAALDRSMACLGRHRARIDALVGAVATAKDTKHLARAVEAVAKLPDPAACDDPELASEAAADPVVDAAREQLARADQIAQLGDIAQGLELMVAVEATARERDHPGLLAEALTRRGLHLSDEQRADEAFALLTDAYVEATRAGDRLTAVEAATGLMYVSSRQRGQAADAELWARLAEASLTDTMRASARGVSLADARGVLAFDRGQNQEAATAFEEALAIHDQMEGADEVDVCAVHDHLGSAKVLLGDVDGAHAEYERALELCTQRFGAMHPRTATPLGNRGQVEMMRGNIPAARASVEAALAIYLASAGPNDRRVAMMRHNLGTLCQIQEDVDCGERELTAAHASLRAALGPDHPDVAVAIEALGGVSLARKRFDEASMRYDEAIRIVTAAHGADAPGLVDPLVGKGVALRELGRIVEAKTVHERAVVIAEASDGRDGLAHALAALGHDRALLGDVAGARDVLGRARTRAAELQDSSLLDEIDAQLAALPRDREH